MHSGSVPDHPTPTPSALPDNASDNAASESVRRGPPTLPEVIRHTLSTYMGGGTPDDEDALFAWHTTLVNLALDGAVPTNWLVAAWQELEPIVLEAEKRLQKNIHKGAPYYNCGICLFMAGDFDGAYYFFDLAARQDELIQRNSFPGILIGAHPLSRQVIIDPLLKSLMPRWASDYQRATGRVLDDTELISLLGWLAKRPNDAFTVVTALHRLHRSLDRKANDAVRLCTVRATADLLIALESSLRRVQGVGAYAGKQLGPRLSIELQQAPSVSAVFKNLDDWFKNKYPGGAKESATAVNDLVGEAIRRFDAASSAAACAGIIACASYRLRNNVLHVNEESLDLFLDRECGLRMAGWALAGIRLIKHADDRTLSSIP